MRFVIRDDDTSFFTRFEELEDSYGDLWNQIPISFAVIPFDVLTRHRGEPKRLHQESTGVPLSENAALVRHLDRLVQAGRIDIMQHGYNHFYKRLDDAPFNPQTWIPEFVHLENKEEKLREGRGLLETLFHVPVDVFVPPSNAISRDGLRALEAVGLDQACLSHIRDLVAIDPLNLVRAVGARLDSAFPYSVRRYARHRELWCHPLTPTCDWSALRARFEACSRCHGTFAVATHYWERDHENPSAGAPLRVLLRELTERAAAQGAQFVRMREVFPR